VIGEIMVRKKGRIPVVLVEMFHNFLRATPHEYMVSRSAQVVGQAGAKGAFNLIRDGERVVQYHREPAPRTRILFNFEGFCILNFERIDKPAKLRE
jgi:hypothetical protein